MKIFIILKNLVKIYLDYLVRLWFFLKTNLSGNLAYFPNDVLNPARIIMLRGARLSKCITLKSYRDGCIFLGKNVNIESNCVLESLMGDIKIGSNSTLNQFSIMRAYGDINIGDGVRIGPHVQIMAMNHNFSNPELFIYKQGLSGKGIFIGNNVWIGGNVSILDGVKIGNNCVIGAGSIVTRDIESNSVAVGNPARVIKKLNFKIEKP